MRENFDVIIHSVGSAGAGLIKTLRPVSPLSDRELAGRLFQAPSVVLANLNRKTAHQVTQLLADTGAKVSYQSAHEAFEPGTGDHEIAVSFNHFRHAEEAIKKVAAQLGVTVEKAATLLAQTPAVLVSQISAATLQTFREQLEPLGLEVDSSMPREALYDIYSRERDPHSQHLCRRQLSDEGVTINPDAGSPLIATDVDYDTCQRLWQPFERSASPLVILNQDYQRFDLQLMAGRQTADLDRALVEQFKIPHAILDRLYHRLPMVIARSLPRRQVAGQLETLALLGARAEAHLTTFQAFSLALNKPLTPRNGASLLSLITGKPLAQCQQSLERSPSRLAGPLNNHQARWLQAELRKTGIKASIEPIDPSDESRDAP